MEQLDTPENNKNLVNFEQFSDHINKRFEDSLTEEGLKRMFDLSLDDPKQETITFTTLKNICNQLGEDISNEELREILSKETGNSTELTFKEFYDFMIERGNANK